jgi:N-acyl-D-aspartate/D-glutamate deacylase
MAASSTATSLLIRNARIVDGTGAPARTGSVAVRDGKIVAVGDVPAGTLPRFEAKSKRWIYR